MQVKATMCLLISGQVGVVLAVQKCQNVVEAYNKYHSKGLEIVGVSFDQKKDAWTAMVKETWYGMATNVGPKGLAM